MSIENKLTYLNETKNQIKSALNTPYNVFRDYPTLISKYVKNQPKSIVEGSSAICENAVALPCNIDVNGNSYQETTEGYNKLYLFKNETVTRNGITAEIKENEVTLNGTSTGLTDFYLLGGWGDTTENENRKLKAGKYTLVNYGDSNIVSVNMYNGTKILMNLAKTENIKVVDFTADTYYSVMYISIPMGTTLTNFKLKLGLLEGAYTLDTLPPYEPYTNGASPNTEYKQDIEVIEAYNKVDFSDKVYDGQTFYGVLHTYFDDGSFELDGTATSSSTHRISNIMNKPLKANTTYTIFVEFLSGSVDSNFSHIIQNTDTNTQIAGVSTNKSIVYQFTPTEDIEKWCYGIYHGASKIFSKLKLRIMVVKGKFSNISDLLYLPYGHIGLKQGGINKVDISKVSNVAWGSIADEIITTNALNTATSTNVSRIDFEKPLDVEVGKKYYVSFDCKISSGTIQELRLVQFMNNSNTSVIGVSKKIEVPTPSSNYQRYVFLVDVANEGSQKIYIQGYNTNNCILNIKNVQISELDLPYEPYIEPITKEIDLAGHSLAKVNEVDKDKLVIGTNGSVKLNKNINSHKCTSEDVNYVASNNRLFLDTAVCSDRYILPGEFYNINIDKPYIYSNIAKSYYGKPLGELASIEKGDFVSLWNSTALGILFRFNNITTSEQAKEYFDNNNVYVMYKKAETEVIELPSIEPITLFKGTNVFELVTNLGTTMAVEYIVDAESLTNEITELENAVIELGGTI